jgi:hypothetical protein
MKSRYLNLAALLLLTGVAVQAEPYMAVRTGFKCSQCHLNQSGGAGRTEYGQAYTEYKLILKQTQEAIQSTREGALTSFNPKLNESVTIGGNFRTEGVVTQKQGALAADRNHQVAESNLYINVELVKNFLSLYIDQNMAAGSNREMWMKVRKLPLNSYVKIGRTLLPYGYRLMDDQAFVRANTGYTYGTTQLAGEVGLEPGPFSLIANMTNTNFSTVGSVVFRKFRVGGSYGTTTEGPKSSTYGPFAGVNFGIFTALAEVDFIKEPLNDTTDVNRVAHFYELNAAPVQGLNVKTTFEYLDADTKIGNARDGQQRWTFGAEIFPIQHLQVGAYYRLNSGNPKSDLSNQDMLITRAHVFF